MEIGNDDGINTNNTDDARTGTIRTITIDDGNGTGSEASSGTGNHIGENDRAGNETRSGAGNGLAGISIDDAVRSTGNDNGNRGESVRRGPGRPKGSRNKPRNSDGTADETTRSVYAAVESTSNETKKRAPRRSKKITADQVEAGVSQMFGLVAMARGPHWKVDKKEVQSWSNDAAELLNKIPSSTYEKFTQIAPIITVAVGIGGIVVPRAMVDIATHKMLEDTRKAKEAVTTETGVETVSIDPDKNTPSDSSNNDVSTNESNFLLNTSLLSEGF